MQTFKIESHARGRVQMSLVTESARDGQGVLNRVRRLCGGRVEARLEGLAVTIEVAEELLDDLDQELVSNGFDLED